MEQKKNEMRQTGPSIVQVAMYKEPLDNLVPGKKAWVESKVDEGVDNWEFEQALTLQSSS